ncbi:MAG: hypothetical protein ACP5VS_17950, partial [Desulfomonilaceae bacterium]
CLERKWTLVSSYGSMAYLAISWMGKGSDLVVVCDRPLPFMEVDHVRKEFYSVFCDIFDLKNTLFLSCFPPGVLPKSKLRSPMRDEMAGLISDIVLPCEVRPAGNMARLLEMARFNRKRVIIRKFNNTKPTTPKKLSSIKSPSTDALPFCTVRLENYNEKMFIHYTRKCVGPWPGQSWSSYLSDLIGDKPGSSHSGLETLKRILLERKIRASSKWSRGSTPVVSFTETAPDQFNLIHKWRRGLMRHTFEPFGIAFVSEALLDKGVKKVIYGSNGDFKDLSQDAKAFFQLSSSSCGEWTPEAEWRLVGDLDFGDMRPSDWFIIVPNDQSARILLDTLYIRGLRVYVSNFEATGRSSKIKGKIT